MRRYCRRRICNVFTPKPYFHVAPAYAGVKFGLAPRQYAGVKRLLTPNQLGKTYMDSILALETLKDALITEWNKIPQEKID